MRARRARRCFAIALLAIVAESAGAGSAGAATDARVALDPQRSSARFGVTVMWLVGLEGRFGTVSGEVGIDRFRSQAVVEARIDANSVRMRGPGVESRVKSAEFFDVANHPEIRFVSAPFPLARLRGGGDLPGTVYLRGSEAAVVFHLEPTTCARPAYDCPVEATGEIRRSLFGMRSRRATLSDRVELSLSIYADPQSSASPLP